MNILFNKTNKFLMHTDGIHAPYVSFSKTFSN